MNNENEILVPKKTSIVISDRTYQLGKISLKQAILFSRFIAANILSKHAKLQELKAKTKDSTSNAQDLMSIVELLDPQEVYKLFSILLIEDDLAFLESNLDLDTSVEIIAIFCEHNNFDKVKKNVKRIGEALK
jgi:hypothetical protein